jgi:drug/metabolite transporter (DMT)-like permease
MSNPPTSNIWITLTPAIFVVLWATGFIGAKFGLPYSEPLTFLVWRFGVVVVLFIIVSLVMKATWPKTPREAFHSLMTGMLIHGLYLGGVFWAIARGMPAGVSALIVGFQPIVTAIFAGLLLGEKISIKQWVGLMIGLAGLALVLGPRLPDGGMAWGDNIALLLNTIALGGITLGTIYQKAFVPSTDLRTGAVYQYIGGWLVVTLGMLLFEGGRIEWSPQLIGAMVWLVVALSFGATTLLMLLIRRGAVSKVATLFYLVPAVTSLIAWFLFDENLTPLQLAGVGVIMFAVWLATSAAKART